MELFQWYLLGWWLLGIIGCCLVIWVDGYLRIDDVPIIVSWSLFGLLAFLIGLCVYFLSKLPKDGVIWERKRK